MALAGTPAAQPAAKADAARLRALFFGRDVDTAVIEAANAGVAASGKSDAKAWYALDLARNGDDAKAIALAEEMTKKKPADPWSWFALAGALNYSRERPTDAIAAAERALKMRPKDPDFVWLRAQTLASDEKHRDEAIAFVNRERARVKNPAELLVSKAYALFQQSTGETSPDETKLAAALATFEEARKIDAANLSAWYLPGTYLTGMRRSDEAYPLLEKAVALAPRSTAVRREYWRSITGSRERSAERKRQQLEADVSAFLKANGDRVSVLYAVAAVSGDMKWEDRKKACEERILAEFPDTAQADWIIAGRWRDLGQTEAGTKSPEYRKLLSDYVAKPQHFITTGVLGEAYRELFFVLAADKTVSGDELYLTAKGALHYETANPHIVWVSIPIQLAEHKVHLSDAERIARDGIDVLRKKVESDRSFFKSEGEYTRSLESMTGIGHDALGWVLFIEGRVDEAEKELLAAYELNHNSRDLADHLGRLYLARGNEVKAEEYFVKGLAVQGRGTNPSETSLRGLYEKRHGATDGFDAYLVTLRDTDRARRHDRILGERIPDPQPVPAFSLKDLAGKRVTLDDLKGKVVVVNYWGVWCGWCVAELPEYQKLFEQYATDPDVAILTIDNDQNPDDVPPWMAQKKYTFPVLIDDRYVEKTGITAFPTTWFLDRQGRKAFEKVGWSEKLLEEFGWRIEALKSGQR
jgi:tetratricopeptide (TPR) repeat protein